MKLLNINDVEDGMVAGKDIVSPAGQCLVSKGVAMTASILKSLKRSDISELHVEEASEKDIFTDKEIMNAENKCLKKTEEKFYSKPEDPMMKVIFKAALRSEALEYLKCKKAS